MTHRRCTNTHHTRCLNHLCLLPLLNYSLCQEQLPATGVPVSRNRLDHMQEKFRDYVKNRTLQNWKFWIVSFNSTAQTENSPGLKQHMGAFFFCPTGTGKALNIIKEVQLEVQVHEFERSCDTRTPHRNLQDYLTDFRCNFIRCDDCQVYSRITN